MDDNQKKELEEAVNAHLFKIDKQVGKFIDDGINDKTISKDDFTKNPETGHELYKFNDQGGVEIIFNYTLGKVFRYGGNINTIT